MIIIRLECSEHVLVELEVEVRKCVRRTQVPGRSREQHFIPFRTSCAILESVLDAFLGFGAMEMKDLDVEAGSVEWPTPIALPIELRSQCLQHMLLMIEVFNQYAL